MPDRYTLKISKYPKQESLGLKLLGDEIHEDGTVETTSYEVVTVVDVDDETTLRNRSRRRSTARRRSADAEVVAAAATTMQPRRSRKRTRSEVREVIVSPDSPVIHVAQDVMSWARSVATREAPPPSSSLDDVVERAFSSRDRVACDAYRYNRDVIRGVLVSMVKGGDVLESVSISKPHRRKEGGGVDVLKTKKISSTDDVRDMLPVFERKESYPMYMTFVRKHDGARNEVINVYGEEDEEEEEEGGHGRGPGKRRKSKPKPPPADLEVVDLLNSESENEDTYATNSQKNSYNGVEHEPFITDLTVAPASRFSFPVAAPDPTPSFEVDDWVATPYGPGRVVSSRTERVTESDCYLVEPFVMYELRLSRGSTRCHVPSWELSPLEGSMYAQKRVLSFKGASLDNMDLLRLWPGTYLNDNLVNFYLKWLTTRRKRPRFSSYTFPTYFYSRISRAEGGGSLYRNTPEARCSLWNELKGWTKGVDIFRKRFLLFPINFDLHWTFVAVCNPSDVAASLRRKRERCDEEKHIMMDANASGIVRIADDDDKDDELPPTSCIVHFDSGKDLKLHRPSTIFNVIRKYLTACWEHTAADDVAPSPRNNGPEIVVVDVTTNNNHNDATTTTTSPSVTSKELPGFSPRVPAQTNLTDCGVFMLEMMERFLERPPKVDAAFVETKGGPSLAAAAVASSSSRGTSRPGTRGDKANEGSSTSVGGGPTCWFDFDQGTIDAKRTFMYDLIHELKEE